MSNSDLSHLEQFLGGYFHQDWMIDDTDAESVLDRYLSDTPPAAVQQTISEVERLLGRGLAEDQLHAPFIQALGCYYNPAAQGMSYTEWLNWVRDSLIKE